MGYALQYELQTIKVTKNKKKREFLRYIGMMLVLVLCVTAMNLGGTVFQTVILGERGTVKAAAEQMVADIKEGVSFHDAVGAFYAELAE